MKNSMLGALILLAAVASACATTGRSATALPEPGDLVDGPAEGTVLSVDLALSAASAYFAAFNGGDFDALMALLPSGATFSDSISGTVTRDEWEQRLAWNLAQGTKLATPDCLVSTDGDPDATTVVECESATSSAPIQAVGARPVPTTIFISVTPSGIREVREEYGQPDFLAATQPFVSWMAQTHPVDAERVGFGVWGSVTEARENGQLSAEYARRWAASLEASCRVIPGLISPERDSYLDDC